MEDKGSSCRMCGKCCYFEIPVTLLDIYRLAQHIGVSSERAFSGYIQDQVSLRSGLFMMRKNKQRACIFLTDSNRCSVHSAKPGSCRFYYCRPDADSAEEVMPWTSTCTAENARAELWEQSVAAVITRAYITNNGTAWDETAYYKAVLSIYDNILTSENQTIKLARTPENTPVAMLYDCTQCERRGLCAEETPITLDDIRRITYRKGISWENFFKRYIASAPSINTGGLKLQRHEHCVFFDPNTHCTIQDVRPMHCRFTPCPGRTENAQQMSCLYLGSGTVEEQFRHQVALSVTRQYVEQWGVKYNRFAMRKTLGNMDSVTGDEKALEAFCQEIAPFRYVDDTPAVLKQQKGA